MSLIHYEKNFNELIKKEAVVDFYATWCGPCKMFGPIFEEVSKEKDVNYTQIVGILKDLDINKMTPISAICARKSD